MSDELLRLKILCSKHQLSDKLLQLSTDVINSTSHKESQQTYKKFWKFILKHKLEKEEELITLVRTKISDIKPEAAKTKNSLTRVPDFCDSSQNSSRKSNVLKQYANKQISLDEFIEKYSGVSWGPCDWGSCQYSSCLGMYKTLLNLKSEGLDPTKTIGCGWKPLARILQRYPPVVDQNNIKTMIRKILNVTNHSNRNSDDSDDDSEESEESGSDKDKVKDENEDEDEGTNTNNSGCAPETLEQLFEMLKQQSYDLWTTTSIVCKELFRTDFSSNAFKPRLTKSLVGNQILQSQNYTTGLQCFILVHTGLIKNDNCFAGFHENVSICEPTQQI